MTLVTEDNTYITLFPIKLLLFPQLPYEDRPVIKSTSEVVSWPLHQCLHLLLEIIGPIITAYIIHCICHLILCPTYLQ